MNLFKNDHTQPDQNEFISGYYLDLAQQIVQIRQELNISQTELAAKLCISARTLESWERGVRHPSSSAQALIKLFIKSPQFVLENLA
ncbi:helix-turn-helix domain-containing protein [Acinetobacter rudis]|uniref:helix-turn-helix domain-containing protein n=1 Tax=Acinetobacter TaxID=469 RepID=UPI00280DE521|nr:MULTISPECIES: helix-turn-helix domain-containing protein [Acinetobacter]MDQ8951508.1 helix-turn-helix domain-containing protein [Acinetobacter rudis]MDV2441229.1 helix-turn-helix domain-containing protein [Acinetobacter gerneri]